MRTRLAACSTGCCKPSGREDSDRAPIAGGVGRRFHRTWPDSYYPHQTSFVDSGVAISRQFVSQLLQVAPSCKRCLINILIARRRVSEHGTKAGTSV